MMDQVFKDLKPVDAMPPDGLKQEVFTSLETLQLIADVLDLFTSQFIMSEAELTNLFDSDFYKEKKEDSEDEDENNNHE